MKSLYLVILTLFASIASAAEGPARPDAVDKEKAAVAEEKPAAAVRLIEDRRNELTLYDMLASDGTVAQRVFYDARGRATVEIYYHGAPNVPPRGKAKEKDLVVSKVCIVSYDETGRQLHGWLTGERVPAERGTLSANVVKYLVDAERLAIHWAIDDDLKELAKLPRLRSLDLSDSIITVAGLRHLRAVPNLEKLTLGGARMVDFAPDEKTGITPPKIMAMYGKGIDKEGFAELQSWKKLRGLGLVNIAATHHKIDDLAAIEKMQKLEELRLEREAVGDAGLAHLKALKALKSLDLVSLGITDAGLANLKDLPNLQRLNVSDMPIDGTGLQHLGGLKNLKTLLLEQTKVTDAALANLKPLAELETLYLTGSRVTDAGLEHLKGLKNLKNLNLSLTRVTPEGVKALQEALPKCSIQAHSLRTQ